MATAQPAYVMVNRSNQQRSFEIVRGETRELISLGARDWSPSFETPITGAQYKALRQLPVVKMLLAKNDISFHTANAEA